MRNIEQWKTDVRLKRRDKGTERAENEDGINVKKRIMRTRVFKMVGRNKDNI